MRVKLQRLTSILLAIILAVSMIVVPFSSVSAAGVGSVIASLSVKGLRAVVSGACQGLGEYFYDIFANLGTSRFPHMYWGSYTESLAISITVQHGKVSMHDGTPAHGGYRFMLSTSLLCKIVGTLQMVIAWCPRLPRKTNSGTGGKRTGRTSVRGLKTILGLALDPAMDPVMVPANQRRIIRL